MTGTQLREPTRVSSPWLLGCTRELLRDPLGLGMRAFEECGDVARYDPGPLGPRRPNFGVNHPDGAARVFSAATYRDYRKDSRFFGPLRDLYGDGLLTSQDETWLRQRRFIQPLFITRSVDGYATVMAREVDRLSGEWRGQPDSEVVDLHAEIVRLTLRIVARVLFGADAERMLPVVRADFPVLGRAALRRFTVPYPAPLSWPTPANRRIARARARIAAVCDEIIADRQAATTPGEDLIGRLIAARDGSEALSDKEIRDQIRIFLFAGHDTTATLVTFALYLLGRDAQAQERVRREAERQLPEAPPTTADLAALGETTMVLKEVARLYPPAPYVSRVSVRDSEICGYRIPAHSDVTVSPWVIHHRADLWPDPFRFDPHRFAPGKEDERHKFAWLPFGHGPRGCIGERFAMLEAGIAVARLVRDFEFVTPPGDIQLTTDLVLHPVGPVPCRIRCRAQVRR
ncbi:cytochrome P450 [Nocardia tengchongensis]|uniref:cytochrome P450 n=1 Tax=Nocardia tengchongensis TaxID=2055889 RepID=UPI00368E319F